MKTKYDVSYFIRKYEAIPEKKWCTGRLNKIILKFPFYIQHCVLGFTNRARGSASEEYSLITLIQEHLNVHPFSINDFPSDMFPQSTPKQRNLAALYYIKNKLSKVEVIKYVTVEVDHMVKELTKELALN